MDLHDIIQQIKVWEPWVENYKNMVPKFIDEASQNKDWSEWDKNTFDVYFNQLDGNPISSMKQGYFTLEQRDLIKSHWRDFSKDLQDIALSQTVPLFDKYEAIVNKINSLYDGNRYASINRMIAGLQPQLLCTIVNGMHLNNFCYYLETYCGGKYKFEGDYFHKSHQICTLFNSLQPHRSYYENVTLPWQTYEYFRDYLQKNNHNKGLMNDLKNLILSNHNIILTGAPGTGKTYLAKLIAAQMILGKEYDEKKASDDEKKKMEDQYDFVQFHPSYDYTDFVEGLRPFKDDDGHIGFERQDGIFKLFCKRAINNLSDNNMIEQFDSIWVRLIKDVQDELLKGKLTKIGSFDYGLSSKNSLKYISKGTQSGYTFTTTKENVLSAYMGNKARPSGGLQKYINEVVSYMQEKYGLPSFKERNNISEKKQYVFVIDEINRGEISKIFGELFFSIDPGYRGTDGKVKTQYQNLVEEDDVFYDGFYVPENVYIIGTMNDIDRSVESMDFAFRRRFAFKEITAEDSQQMLDSESAWGKDENGKSLKPSPEVISEIIKRMGALNDAICPEKKDSNKKGIEGLSSAYHIGASYFLKLTNYQKDDGTFDYDKLWDYHLKGLLSEYLRGMPDAEDKIKSLGEAFGIKTLDSNPS